MLDTLGNKYQSLDGKLSRNVYDPIKHLVSPGFHINIVTNDHPTTPNNTTGHDDDGYLKPNTNGSRSAEDSGIIQEKTHEEDNLDHSTYGYLEPVSVDGSSGYIDNYLETAQVVPPFEYTQPYQFSPAGYMAPVSNNRRPYQFEVADPGFSRRMPHQSQLRAHQANFLPHFPKTPTKMNTFGPRGKLRLPTPAPWIRQ